MFSPLTLYKIFYLKRIINISKRQIGKGILNILVTLSQQKKLSLFETLSRLDETSLSSNVTKKLSEFRVFIDCIRHQLLTDSFNNLSYIITYIDGGTSYSSQTKINANNNKNKSSIYYTEELKSLILQVDYNSKGNTFHKLI